MRIEDEIAKRSGVRHSPRSRWECSEGVRRSQQQLRLHNHARRQPQQTTFHIMVKRLFPSPLGPVSSSSGLAVNLDGHYPRGLLSVLALSSIPLRSVLAHYPYLQFSVAA